MNTHTQITAMQINNNIHVSVFQIHKTGYVLTKILSMGIDDICPNACPIGTVTPQTSVFFCSIAWHFICNQSF
jgi:hypothetical protein